MAEQRQPSGVIRIGTTDFLLATDEEGKPAWKLTQFQTQEGDPTVPGRWIWRDWSRGLGDSRGAFRGAVHYAENAYLGAQGRILPGPKITQIETNLDADGTDIVEVTLPAPRVLVCGGTKVVEVTPSTHAVAATNTLTGGLLSMALFDDEVAIAAGDSVDYYVRNAAGAYAQNNQVKKARCFGLATNGDLIRGYNNTRSLASRGANITTVDNWSAELVIGDPSGKMNQVFGHHGWEYALKDEGLYTYDSENSEERSVLADLEDWKSAENRWFFKWYDQVFVCTLAGLYRYVQQGLARTVGIEEIPFNESELTNVYPTAGAAFGRHLYVAWTDGTDTWITLGRRAMDGDASGASPYTFLCVIEKLTALKVRAMRSVVGTSSPELWYTAGGDVRYFELTRDGLPAEYRDSGTFTVESSPSDFGAPMTLKQARKYEIIARNLSAARNIQMATRFDGGNYNNTGSAMTSLSGGFAEAFFTRGTNDQGREIGWKATVGLDSASTPPQILAVVLDFELRPEMVEGAVIGVSFQDYFVKSGVSSRLTAQEQREAMEALLDGALVEITDINGSTFACRVSAFQGDLREMFAGAEAAFDVAVGIRRLDYA